ncbi:MAG: hypothetical protein WC052_04475 [Patescibacteria group bacterium]
MTQYPPIAKTLEIIQACQSGSLKTVPDCDWTEEIVLDVIPLLVEAYYDVLFDHIPERCKTYKVWCRISAIYRKILEHSRVPTEIATQSFYEDVMRQNCMVLSVIPRRYRTTNLCMIAANNDDLKSSDYFSGSVLEHVPHESQTEEMILSVIGKHGGFELQYAAFQTPAICIAAVETEPIMIAIVIDQTFAVCEAAIRAAENLQEVLISIRNQTPELCIMAINSVGNGYTHDELRDIVFAIRNHTLEVCISIVRYRPHMLAFLQNHHQEICLEVIDRIHPSEVTHILIDIRERTLAVCIAAYKKDQNSFQAIRDPGMRRQVVRQVLSNMLISLRGANLSTSLLTEVCECMLDKNWPSMMWMNPQILSPTQLWALAAKVKHFE